MPALRLRPRAIATMAAVAAVVVALAAWPASAQYPLTSGTLAVEGASPADPVAPGDGVSLAGGGFAPGATVQIWLHSDPILLDTIRADATGAIETAVTIPSNVPPGSHTLQARGPAPGGGTIVLAADIAVAAGGAQAEDAEPVAAVAPGDDETPFVEGAKDALPFTGLPLFLVVLIGTGLLFAGGLLAHRTRGRHDG